MRITKMIKNKKLMRIVMTLLLVFILIPFLPYKFILSFGGLRYYSYEKLKVKNSPTDGLVLTENCNELGLKSGKELEGYLLHDDKLDKELTIFKKGLGNYKFTLYGEFIKNDNKARKFYVREWNSVYITLSDTFIWKDKLELIYKVSVLPLLLILVLLLIASKKQKVKKQ